MARGSDPGRDFDDQYNQSRRAGQERAARNEGPWAGDKYLKRVNDSGPVSHRGEPKGCADKTAALFLLGVAAGYGLVEVVSRVA